MSMNDLHSATRTTILRPFSLRAAAAFTLACALSTVGCKTAAPTDDALTRSVQTKLSSDTSLTSEPIQTSVQHAVVTLDGSVSNDAARSLAANDAAQVPGIKTVVNNLTVQPNTSSSMTQPANGTANRASNSSMARSGSSGHTSQEARPSASVQQAAPPPTPEQQAAAPIERPAPPVEQAPAFRSITLPTDSTLPVRINTALDSATTQEGDAFSGSIASDVVSDGLVVLAHGTPVSGRVSAVHEAAHFKGSSLLTITLTDIDRRGSHLSVTTDEYSKAGNGRGKNTAEKVGGGAAVGAILGGILGGGKGAAIGAGVGGGAGAGVQAATRGKQVQIPAESLVRFHLTGPLSVRVSTGDKSRSAAAQDGDLQHHDE